MNQFANMIHIEFRNYSARIRVQLKHFTMLQNSGHVLISDIWRVLLAVVLLNGLQILKGRLCDP